MDTALRLAIAFLDDEIMEPDEVGLVRGRRLSRNEQAAARTAIDEMLRSPRPPRDLLNALAEAFSNHPVSGMTRTKAYIRRKKGPWANRMRDFDIMNAVMVQQRFYRKTLPEAFEIVAEKWGLTDFGVADIWNRYPALREALKWQ